jgi:hypothetical protein
MTVKKAFRILSLFMIFILTITSAVSLVSVTAVATAPKTYTDISADSEKEVNITHDGEIIYFRFVPAKSGTYAFYSTEYENYPYGFLYDENMEMLANSSDNSALNNFNFNIEYECKADKVYYIGAASFESNDSYKLNVKTVSLDPIPKISVGSAENMAGDYVTVDISVSENTGVLGAILTLNYGDDLTLIKAESGNAWSKLELTKPGAYAKGCNFVWDGLYEADSENGAVLTLTFLIPRSAKAGTVYDISVECTGIDASLQEIKFELNEGTVTVSEGMRGDVDRDKEITLADIIKLRRYISDGNGENIDVSAADINNDGHVDNTDLTMLRQYLAGGYGVEL